MAISIGRLSGGNTPADGSDPRTFPAIWNATADTLEGLSNTVDGLEVGDLADATVTSPSFGQPLTYDPVSEQWVNDSGNYPVMVFADSSARSSAIPSPSEGMVTYVEDANRVEVYDGAAFGPIGGILQVVSTTKTDVFSTSSSSFTDVTGLSATITPSSTSSKVLIFIDLMASNVGSSTDRARIVRDATPIAVGSSGDGYFASNTGSAGSALAIDMGLNFLDSPNSTSALTYQVQVQAGSNTLHVNRRGNTSTPTGVSSITLMEVAV